MINYFQASLHYFFPIREQSNNLFNQIMKTSIIIVNYNAGNLLKNCLSSVFKTRNNYFEVILVDNASNDQSHQKCKEEFPEITLIENKTNLGFCEGNNVGIKNAKGDFFVFLNPDTEVEPEWLNELHKAYETFGEGLFQPKLKDLDDRQKFNTTGNMLTPFGFGFLRGYNEKDIGQYENIEHISYCSGACLFIPRKILDKTGCFDPYLFAFYEDTSLSWKAAMLGIKSYYVPKAIVYHKSGYSFKKNTKMVYLMQRNRWYLLLTHFSRKTFYKILPKLILLEIIVFFNYLFTGRIKGKILAYRDIINDRKILWKKYIEFQKNRKVADKEIISNFMYIPKFPKSGPTYSRYFYLLLKALS